MYRSKLLYRQRNYDELDFVFTEKNNLYAIIREYSVNVILRSAVTCDQSLVIARTDFH